MENPFTDEYFMKKALQEAEMAFKKGEIPVGAVIVIDNKVIDNQIFKTKEKYIPSAEYPFAFVVGKMLKNKPEDYTDVRGLVTADYQDYLEHQWIEALRAKYPVKVDQNVLKTVKKN